MREEILNTVIELKEKSTDKIIPVIKKELNFESNKYSSINQPIWHVFINDIKIKYFFKTIPYPPYIPFNIIYYYILE